MSTTLGVFLLTMVICRSVICPGTAAEEQSTEMPSTFATRRWDPAGGEETTGRSVLDSDLVTEAPAAKILFYSEWSPWSSCLDNCEKTRRRRCQNEKKCGKIVLKETQTCPHHHNQRSKRKCHRAQNRRKHRHKTTHFHVVQLNPNNRHQLSTNHRHTSPRTSRKHHQKKQSSSLVNSPLQWYQHIPRLQNNPSNHWGNPVPPSTHVPNSNPRHALANGNTQSQSPYWLLGTEQDVQFPRESSVIFPRVSSDSSVSGSVSSGVSGGVNTAADRERSDRIKARYESKLYGKWTRWSKCTRSCTTQRRRLCKRRDLCGGDVIREAAYCYVEGSFCQRWIQRQIQQNEAENEAVQDYYIDDDYSGKNKGSYPKKKKPSSGSQDEYLPMGECGVAGNKTRSLGNMLRIIGGRPTSKGRWPWQVAVLNRFREAFCGGTLVSSRWVLTAAHCVRKRLYVRIGEHDLSEKEGTEIELRIDHIVQHPSYDAETVDNDVALLRLPSAVHPDRYRGIACLPKPRQALPTSQYCTIIGWGKRISSDSFGTDILHEAEVPIVPSDVCRNVYEEYHITGNMFCAGYRRGRMDSCAGDSGGPLLCKEGNKWTIFGITSFGEGCGKKGKYGIYTRLSNYIKWIQKTIKNT